MNKLIAILALVGALVSPSFAAKATQIGTLRAAVERAAAKEGFASRKAFDVVKEKGPRGGLRFSASKRVSQSGSVIVSGAYQVKDGKVSRVRMGQFSYIH